MRRRSKTIEPLESRRLLAANPSVVDVLALYTPGALAYHSGDATRLASHVHAAVDSANLAMVNSEISAVLRLVRVDPIAYTGSNNLSVDRERLANPADGFMDSAHSLRNTYGADLVALITEGTQNGGNASLPASLAQLNTGNFAFSANNVDAIQPGNLTLAHELAHNLGAGHERDNIFDPVPGIFPYSHGHRFIGSDGNTYHDVMSYDPGMVVYHFANPAVSYRGTPTGKPAGDPAAADIAATFAQTVPVVSGFRPSATSDTSGPTATLYQTQTAAAPLGAVQLDFTLRIADPVGVNASTIDAEDAAVTLPAAFGSHVLNAGLVHVEGGSAGGAHKLVTYRVVLPSEEVPLTALAYSLKAGAVADSFGNLAPAATIAHNTAALSNVGFAAARDLGPLELNGGGLRLFESLSTFIGQTDKTYRLAVTAPGTLAVQLSGNTADVGVFIARDADGNGRYDFSTDLIVFSSNSGRAAPEAAAAAVTAGEYYVWVFGGVSSPYELTIRQYSDTTPPTATVDATDLFTTGAPYIDFAVTYEDDVLIDGATSRYESAIDIRAQLDNGADFTFFYFPEPAINTPYALTAKSQTIQFRIFPFNGTDWTAFDNGLYTLSIHANTPGQRRRQDTAGNEIPLLTLGSFRIAIGQNDVVEPSAEMADAAVSVPGATAQSITVVYDDNVALNAATFGAGDVRIVGPNGFDVPANLQSVAPAPLAGGRRAATYTFTPPGGSWDFADRGAYSVVLQAGQVADTSGNTAAAGVVGAFDVEIPLPGDANGSSSVNLDDFTTLAANFGQHPRGIAGGDFNYDNRVSLDDFTILASRFGQSLPSRLALRHPLTFDLPARQAGGTFFSIEVMDQRPTIELFSDSE